MVRLVDRGLKTNPPANYFCSRGYDESCLAQDIQLDVRADRHVIVTHSMGGFFVDETIVRKANACFVISGFTNFHAVNPAGTKTILRRMIRALKLSPGNVLQEFHQNMAYPLQGVERQQVVDGLKLNSCAVALYTDLNMLNELTIPSDYLAGIPNVVIFHGSKDKIVPSQQAVLLANHCQSGVHVIENGGHALPLTHAELMASEIIKACPSPKI